MKSLAIYDSNFGNTQKIAEAIAEELGTKAMRVSEVQLGNLSGLELLVVGSPIIGWQPTVPTQELFVKLKPEDLKGTRVAVFDTRVKLFIHGDAKLKMAQALEAVGAKVATAPEHFYVRGQKGPLLAGELGRAVAWAKEFSKQI